MKSTCNPSVLRRTLCRAGFATVLAVTSIGGRAADEILIGASLPLSGPNAEAGAESLAVALAAFAAINQAGGIQGRQLRLVALDDRSAPAQAADNARRLNALGALALFNCWGTASCSAILPVITELKLPLVGGIAGGGPMRSSPGRYAFNVRGTTEDEIERMVRQMATISQVRIGVVYQDDAFGRSGQEAAARVMQRMGVAPTTESQLAADGSNVAAVIETLRKSETQGAVVVASSLALTRLVRRSRVAGLGTQFYVLAAQAHRKVADELGEHTAGVVFTTLVPSPWNAGVPVARDYQKAVSAAGSRRELSYLGMEVFINAQVLIEGLRKAGGNASREALVSALEGMGELRFGKLSLRYTPQSRRGSSYVGLAILSRTGNFIE
jgi:branched-chain amino acid transport system substrate-binding protein